VLVTSAFFLNILLIILDVAVTSVPMRLQRSLAPTTPDLAHIDGSFRDPQAFLVNVLAVDVEHIGTDLLEEVQAEVEVHLQSHSIPITPFLDVAEPTYDSRNRGT
jgi:hypothetical protein